MIDFFDAICDPDFGFLRDALLAGLLASVAFGIIGSLVTVRRITYIAGAISHSVLGGIGAGIWLQHAVGVGWFHPMIGGVAVALLSALVIGAVSLCAQQREDTVIGAVWAVGMAAGLIFLAKTPGYNDPMSYLFGNILLIAHSDLWVVAGLDLVVLGVIGVFYNKLQATCFDEQFTALRGVSVRVLYLLLLCLTALTVILLIQVVGVVLVIALLTLPAAVAGHFARHLWQMMLLAVACCMLFVGTGLAVSYEFDLPSGPTVVLLAAVAYLAAALALHLVRRASAARLRRGASRP